MTLSEWRLLSSGGGQASLGQSLVTSLLSLLVPFDPVLVHSIGSWTPARGIWVSRGSTCLLPKAVGQQQAPSAKLQPAPALLRLDLFYLKEPFEVGLFMHVESSCSGQAGQHTNGGERFHRAVTGLC